MNIYLPFTVRLPSAYQEVEYIESSGATDKAGQYIDTGFTFTENVGQIKMKVMPTSFGSNYYNYRCGGSIQNGDINRAFVLYLAYSTPYIGLGSNDLSTGKSVSVNNIYEWDIQANSGSVNYSVNGDTGSATYSGGIVNGKNYYIFCNDEKYQGDYWHANMRLYYFQIYQSGTLVRDFVPCYRKSDNVIGLYDLVNNQFYTNQGTGTFSKGNDITKNVLKNDYIGEVYEYSYDFRNKSASQVSTDGWTVYSGTLETGSYGITSPIGKDVMLRKSGLDLSTASKITISTNIVWNRDDTNGSRAMNFGIINPTTGWNNVCTFYIASVAAYNGTCVQFNRSGTTTKGTNIGGIGTGAYTPILEIDLVNKTLTGKISGYNNSTYTLTDELVSFIRGLSGLYVYTTQHNYYIQDISITIE